jgi:hypothetical protein
MQVPGGTNLGLVWPSQLNVTSWGQGGQIWVPVWLIRPDVTSCGQGGHMWDQFLASQPNVTSCGSWGTNLRSCSTILTKCDLLEGGGQIWDCFWPSQPNMICWGQGEQIQDCLTKSKSRDKNWILHLCSVLLYCRKVKNGPLLDLPCHSWSPNYSVLVYSPKRYPHIQF